MPAAGMIARCGTACAAVSSATIERRIPKVIGPNKAEMGHKHVETRKVLWRLTVHCVRPLHWMFGDSVGNGRWTATICTVS